MPVKFKVPVDKLDLLREALHSPEGEPIVPKSYEITSTYHLVAISEDDYEALPKEIKKKLKPYMIS